MHNCVSVCVAALLLAAFPLAPALRAQSVSPLLASVNDASGQLRGAPAVASGQPGVAGAAQPPATGLDAGFAQLYALKFDRAHAEFERWIRERPDDPLGPACRLTVYLFQQLQRLRIPHSSLLPDGRTRAVASADLADPALKKMFYDQLLKATAQAQTRAMQQPNDESALLALTLIYAAQADYVNLVEKRSWASLTLFKKSNRYAQQLLKRNPQAHDAWAASGLSEYLADSLPFYARWFVRFDAVKGDKQAAIEQLQRAAAKGRYLRPYAKMLLAGLYLREQRPNEGLRVLKELNSEFPDNPMIAAELRQVSARLRQP